MEKAKKYFGTFMDVLEIYIPSVAIISLFVAFILQIFSRYVLNAPLIWPYELAQVSYLVAIMLGTCYAERSYENIMFTVFYDFLPKSLRKVCDLLSYLLIVVFFVISFPSILEFYSFFMTRYSTVLKLPLGIVYLPYFPFVIITTVRFMFRFVKTLRTPAAMLYKESKATDKEELV